MLDRPPEPLVKRESQAELERLRKRVKQQEHSLAVLAQAVSTLRDGSQALREENRELRAQLQRSRLIAARPSGIAA